MACLQRDRQTLPQRWAGHLHSVPCMLAENGLQQPGWCLGVVDQMGQFQNHRGLLWCRQCVCELTATVCWRVLASSGASQLHVLTEWPCSQMAEPAGRAAVQDY